MFDLTLGRSSDCTGLSRRAFLRIANRITGMDANVAQRMKAAPTLAGHDHRARGGIAPEEMGIGGEARFVINGHQGPRKNSLPFGGEHIRVTKQGRIGRNIGCSAELFSEGGNTGRKVHRRSAVRFRVRPQSPAAA